MTSTAFEKRFGFRRSDINLGNWRLNPYSRWSFQNVSELVPSAVISNTGGLSEEPLADASGLLSEKLMIDGKPETISAFLERSSTDALVVMKAGKFVADYAASTVDPASPHLIFSISKSLTAILAGIVEADGLLDPEAPVTRYVPEAEGSAYGDATVRNLLDMRVSLDFEETYLDPESAYARYRRAMLWNPGGGEEGLLAMLCSIPKGPMPHGGPLRYRSPNSDMLGIVVERAAGIRLSELLSERLWKPLGAKSNAMITVDREGFGRAAGGVSVTGRDLARVGEMMRQAGFAGGKSIVPEPWVRDTISAGDKAAWTAGDFAKLAPNGSYRNQWYQSGMDSHAYCGIGIHGQWLYIDPPTETVIVKLSSQAEPVDDALDLGCLQFFAQIIRLF